MTKMTSGEGCAQPGWTWTFGHAFLPFITLGNGMCSLLYMCFCVGQIRCIAWGLCSYVARRRCARRGRESGERNDQEEKEQ
jgi:hypothetical protein